MPTHPESLIGQVIAGYQLRALLGTGGMGAVFLATDESGCEVAIKILMPPVGINALSLHEISQRFLREAQTLSRLNHPNILSIYSSGVDEDHDRIYMITPYIRGGTLANTVQQGPMALEQVLSYVTQIAAALDYAHERNVIHRDLKPANVLIDENDHVYLADFGIAKVFDVEMSTLTSTNQIIGTPGYMAPEQITNEPVSPATDVYGLAAMTYRLITGWLPFATSSLAATLQLILYSAPQSPRLLRPELPSPAADVILQGLAKKPHERFASAGAFLSALERGLQGQSAAPPAMTIPPVQIFSPTAQVNAYSQPQHPWSTELDTATPDPVMPSGSFPAPQPRVVSNSQSASIELSPAKPKRHLPGLLLVVAVSASLLIVLSFLLLFHPQAERGGQPAVASNEGSQTVVAGMTPARSTLTQTTQPSPTSMPISGEAPTAAPMPTSAATSTSTPTPMPTPTPTPTPTATPTPKPTPTPTPTSAPTPTSTPMPTATPTPAPKPTP